MFQEHPDVPLGAGVFWYRLLSSSWRAGGEKGIPEEQGEKRAQEQNDNCRLLGVQDQV